MYNIKYMFISYYDLKDDTITAMHMITHESHVKQSEPSGRYITVTQ
jgi:hypothetical protein